MSTASPTSDVTAEARILFNQVLAAPDEAFGRVLKLLFDSVTENDFSAVGGGSHRFGYREEDIFTHLQAMAMKVQLSDAGKEIPEPNYIGLRASSKVGEDGNTIARANAGYMRLEAHSCISCSAPQHLSPSYDCTDIGNPTQVRLSQLYRAYVGLHELGHKLEFALRLGTEFSKDTG